jgi:hypothetical protein
MFGNLDNCIKLTAADMLVDLNLKAFHMNPRLPSGDNNEIFLLVPKSLDSSVGIALDCEVDDRGSRV